MKRALALVLLAACGGGDAAPDAGIDAAEIALPACDPPFERIYIQSAIQFLPEGEGRDIDGDGSIDNVIGIVAPLVNPTTATAIAEGLVVLMDFPGLTLPPRGAPDVGVYWPRPVRDVDSPPDPTNNFDGGEFLVGLTGFDAECRPSELVPVHFEDQSFHGEALTTEFSGGGGIADFRRSVMDGEITEDGGHITMTMSGAYTACSLDQLAAFGATPGSILRNLTAGLGLQPDIDLDGDGVEQIVTASNEIVGCVDGDATTVDGPTCACDPRIADGFSAAIHVEAVPASVLGTVP